MADVKSIRPLCLQNYTINKLKWGNKWNYTSGGNSGKDAKSSEMGKS